MTQDDKWIRAKVLLKLLRPLAIGAFVLPCVWYLHYPLGYWLSTACMLAVLWLTCSASMGLIWKAAASQWKASATVWKAADAVNKQHVESYQVLLKDAERAIEILAADKIKWPAQDN